MKWHITEAAPIAEGINTVKIVQKEMGSEAAGVVLKWPYHPSVTKPVMVEQAVWEPALDGEGNPVLDEFGEPTCTQIGTELVKVQQSVHYPYIIEDAGQLRAATDAEVTAIDAAMEIKATNDAAVKLLADKDAYAAEMARIAPILAAHPDPADIVEGGQFYRLPDPDDATILTLWYVRASDYIAQQLSSHDAAGLPINRSVNLRTRESVEFSFEEIVAGLQGQSKAKVKKVGNVGQAKRKAQA